MNVQLTQWNKITNAVGKEDILDDCKQYFTNLSNKMKYGSVEDFLLMRSELDDWFENDLQLLNNEDALKSLRTKWNDIYEGLNLFHKPKYAPIRKVIMENDGIIPTLKECYEMEKEYLELLTSNELEKCAKRVTKALEEINKDICTPIQQAMHDQSLTMVSFLEMLDKAHEKFEAMVKDLWAQLFSYKKKDYQAALEIYSIGDKDLDILEEMCFLYNELYSVFFGWVSHAFTTNGEKARDTYDKYHSLLMIHIERCCIFCNGSEAFKKQMITITHTRPAKETLRVMCLGFKPLAQHVKLSPITANFYWEAHKLLAVATEAVFTQATEKPSIDFTAGPKSYYADISFMLKDPNKPRLETRKDWVTDTLYFLVIKLEIDTIAKMEGMLANFNCKIAYRPCVIVSQTSQMTNGAATLVWNALGVEQNKTNGNFTDRANVPWNEVSEFLKQYWKLKTNVELHDSQLRYLMTRLQCTGTEVEKKKFAKDSVTVGKDPFWKWFLSCVHAVTSKEVAKLEYDNGNIIGFMSKREAEQLLLKPCIPPHTFLLRFSESELESGQKQNSPAIIVMSFVFQSDGTKVVQHLKKYEGKYYLHEQGLTQCLSALEFDNVNGSREMLLRRVIKNDLNTLEPFQCAFPRALGARSENQEDEYFFAISKIFMNIKCDFVPDEATIMDGLEAVPNSSVVCNPLSTRSPAAAAAAAAAVAAHVTPQSHVLQPVPVENPMNDVPLGDIVEGDPIDDNAILDAINGIEMDVDQAQ